MYYTTVITPTPPTVAGFEIPVNQWHRSVLVEVVHPASNLHRPVDKNVRRYPLAGKRTIERSTTRVLHDEAEVRLLKADALQRDDVRVVEQPEELRLLPHVLDSGAHWLVGLLACSLHCHLLAAPHTAIDLAKAADADYFFELQLAEVNLERPARVASWRDLVDDVLVSDVGAWKDADAAADLTRPPAVVAGDAGVAGQDTDLHSVSKRQLVLTRRVVIEDGCPCARTALRRHDAHR